ncbi:hypothetical protein KBW81_18305 (plasmid) [Loktanella salsilacus]|uniref:hypothetical protein n=1 Tax=Loktanella salsilacus TaxID=195913 RepID=UPI0020B89305|nr:hypothetical protein [Loktanella salsilacus]UTH50131.1 hypothetical protein KBW81_18305 [Loktanella salsilacus]
MALRGCSASLIRSVPPQTPAKLRVIVVPLDLSAGYVGGLTDSTSSCALDMALVMPAMLLPSMLLVILGPRSIVATLAIAIIYLPIPARVMRAAALLVTCNKHVAGARS